MGKGRSPNYPAVSLSEAIGLASRLWKKEKRTPVSMDVASQAIGYKSASGPSRVKLSALKKYGLLDESKQGFAISELAMHLLHAQKDSPEYIEHARKAALNVDLFQELASSHLHASAEAIRSHLLLHKGFSEDGADAAIEAFLNTKDFAKLDSDDTIKDGDPVVVGCLVQWTGGTDRFPEPRQVTGISDDREWVFVDGSETGIPMSEVTVQGGSAAGAAQSVGSAPANPLFKKQQDAPIPPGMAKMETLLDEGPVAITWPDTLSSDSFAEFEYWLRGVVRRARRKAGLPAEESSSSGL